MTQKIINMTYRREHGRKVHAPQKYFAKTKPDHPKQLFLKDLRALKENTEIIFYSFESLTLRKLIKEKRQFIRLEISGFYNLHNPTNWTVITRALTGELLREPLRRWGAVHSIAYKGWRQNRWIAFNTGEMEKL